MKKIVQIYLVINLQKKLQKITSFFLNWRYNCQMIFFTRSNYRIETCRKQQVVSFYDDYIKNAVTFVNIISPRI